MEPVQEYDRTTEAIMSTHSEIFEKNPVERDEIEVEYHEKSNRCTVVSSTTSETETARLIHCVVLVDDRSDATQKLSRHPRNDKHEDGTSASRSARGRSFPGRWSHRKSADMKEHHGQKRERQSMMESFNQSIYTRTAMGD